MEKRVVPGNVLVDVRRGLEDLYIKALGERGDHLTEIAALLFLAEYGMPMWAAPTREVDKFTSKYAHEAARRVPPQVLGTARLFYPDGDIQIWVVDGIRRASNAIMIDISRQVCDGPLPYERDTVGCNTDGTYSLISNRTVDVCFA